MRSARIIILAALLLIEVAIIASLRTLGWFGTGVAIHWVVCLIATIFPLVIAAVLLLRHRWQFSLGSLLATTALFAIFLGVSGRPLFDVHTSRRISKQLIAANAQLKTVSSLDGLYTQLGLAPRPTSAARRAADLAPWLRPLVGDASTIPTDDSVREIWLNSDVQIQILCDQPSRFESLERIGISAGVSPGGLRLLRETLPKFQRLVDVHVSDLTLPKDWLASLHKVQTLFLWAEGPLRGSRIPTSDLRCIASLPDLQILMVLGYAVDDSDAGILAGSKSLKHIILRGTAVTASGESALATRLPDCVVHRD